MLADVYATKPNSALARSRKRVVGPVVFCSLPMVKDRSIQRTDLESSVGGLGKGGMVMWNVGDCGRDAAIYGIKGR